jgi:hypothetical protein
MPDTWSTRAPPSLLGSASKWVLLLHSASYSCAPAIALDPLDHLSQVGIMSRGTRFLTLAIPITLVYLLMLAGILPVPLLSSEVTDQILPAVSQPQALSKLFVPC